MCVVEPLRAETKARRAKIACAGNDQRTVSVFTELTVTETLTRQGRSGPHRLPVSGEPQRRLAWAGFAERRGSAVAGVSPFRPGLVRSSSATRHCASRRVRFWFPQGPPSITRPSRRGADWLCGAIVRLSPLNERRGKLSAFLPRADVVTASSEADAA